MAKKKTRPQTVFVIMHYQIVHEDHFDCIQAHVASTLKAAEKYIASAEIPSFSWWQVHPYEIDADPVAEITAKETIYYYNHAGKASKSAPLKQALKAYIKALKDNPELFDCPCCE